ncbi:MAG: MptD family putative ECF transporter S component [Roseburia sp.]
MSDILKYDNDGMQYDAKKWTGKDMINIGVYTAIYFVIIMLCSFMGLVPILMVCYAFIAPIIGAIPMMIYYTKINKFGMLSVTGIITGAMTGLFGMGIYPFIFAIIFTVIADLILKAGKYKSVKAIIASYAVFSLWLLGNYLPIFINPTGYFATRQEYGQEYADALTSFLPLWMLPVMTIGIVVSAVIGAFIAKAVNRKHFEKAGLV